MTSGRDAWRRRVELSADKPFLHASGRRWTYAELDAEAARYAGTLAGLGVGLGTRVLVGLSNRPENVVLMVALLRLGAVEVPLQGGLTFDELAYQIGHSEAEILIADDPVAATVLPRLAELPGITTVVSDRWPGACGLGELGAGPALPWPSLPGHTDRSPALILYTSGSTGRPKGVVLPAGAFASAGAAFDARFGFGPDDTYFLPLTMAHALGIVTAPAMAVMAGGALSLVDRFSPSQFWDQVIASRATVAILFPAHINLLMETARTAPPAEQNPLRLVITHNWAQTFADRFGVELALVWGMTETGAMCTGGHPGERVGDGFVGTPMDGVSIEIRDVYGAPVGPGVDGEIWLHHPHAMLGYLKDEQATAGSLVDGWVRSGDLGTLDENGRAVLPRPDQEHDQTVRGEHQRRGGRERRRRAAGSQRVPGLRRARPDPHRGGRAGGHRDRPGQRRGTTRWGGAHAGALETAPLRRHRRRATAPAGQRQTRPAGGAAGVPRRRRLRPRPRRRPSLIRA